jgi:hypothetical protein
MWQEISHDPNGDCEWGRTTDASTWQEGCPDPSKTMSASQCASSLVEAGLMHIVNFQFDAGLLAVYSEAHSRYLPAISGLKGRTEVSFQNVSTNVHFARI